MRLLVLQSRVNIRVWLHEDHTENTDFLHDYRLALLRLDSRTHPHSHFFGWVVLSRSNYSFVPFKKKKKKKKTTIFSSPPLAVRENRVELPSGTAQLHSLMKEVNRIGLQPGLGASRGKSRERFTHRIRTDLHFAPRVVCLDSSRTVSPRCPGISLSCSAAAARGETPADR